MGKQSKLPLPLVLFAACIMLVAATAIAQHEEDERARSHQESAAEHTPADAQATDEDHAEANHARAGQDDHNEHGAAHDAAHDAGHDDHSGIPHLTNWMSIVIDLLRDDEGRPTQAATFLQRFLDPIFSAIGVTVLMFVLVRVYRRRSQEPGRLQMAIEMIFSSLYGLFETVIGPTARRYTPYLGTLFLFILVNNLLGLFPFMHSSTSAFNTTFSLGILTFIYVQSIAIKENGILGYFYHMAGSPKSGLEWGFVPLLFPLHLLGEFIKPISLSLRLFGNIFGEDTLIATMVMLGVALMAALNIDFVGVPFQFPFMFLAMLTSTIQALVFTLLSTVYIALMLPHEHEEEHGGGEALGH